MVVRDVCKAIRKMMSVIMTKKSFAGGPQGGHEQNKVASFRSIVFSQIIILTMAVFNAFSDATVVQSGSPTFPLRVDNVKLTKYRGQGKKQDSMTIKLPVSLYAELRDNVDTIFTYADALRKHRRELLRTTGTMRNGSCLTFEYMGLWVMRIFFSNNGYGSGKLMAAEDRYPFVVVLTRGFSARMKKLIKTGPK